MIAACIAWFARARFPVLQGVDLPVGTPTAVVLGIVGLVLLFYRRRSPPVARDAVLDELLRRDFTQTDEAHGWRASGRWDGRAIEIRRVSGYESNRFGLPTVVEVTARGRPVDPWPLMPEEGRIVDQRDHAVSIAIPLLSRPGGDAQVVAAISRVLALVSVPDTAPR